MPKEKKVSLCRNMVVKTTEMKIIKGVCCRMSLLIMVLAMVACRAEVITVDEDPGSAYTMTRSISYDGVSVDVIIDKPVGDAHDVLMVFHGTVGFDSLIMQAANNALNGFRRVLDRDDVMVVSVAYPQEDILFGDNIRQAEAALLWLINEAEAELEIDVQKVFIAGHSQGGYIVTRLNTMHATDGVIANAPGPLNLVFRCSLEENGALPSGLVCSLLESEYGPPSANPTPYFERSLLHFTSGYKSDILFVQGLEDSPIQMHSWPGFKDDLQSCSDCQSIQFLELEGMGHNALFNSLQARTAFNKFIEEHSQD